MDKMKERADRHWEETSGLMRKIEDLEAMLKHEVAFIARDRIRELENELDDYDAWYGGPRQDERELHAWIGELEAQIEGLQALTSAGNRDNYLTDDIKSLFSNSDDDGSD